MRRRGAEFLLAMAAATLAIPKRIYGVVEDARVREAGQADLDGDHRRRPGRLAKIERFFDAVAIHPYGPDLDRVRFQVDWALDEMRGAGDRKADFWISEIGWASNHVHNQLGVGRKGQARMLKSFEMFRKKRSDWNVAGINWYAWQDTDEAGFCDFCRRSGLINVNQDPKPSYDAFREQAPG